LNPIPGTIKNNEPTVAQYCKASDVVELARSSSGTAEPADKSSMMIKKSQLLIRVGNCNCVPEDLRVARLVQGVRLWSVCDADTKARRLPQLPVIDGLAPDDDHTVGFAWRAATRDGTDQGCTSRRDPANVHA
jgi:hypothetical protein